MHRHRHRQRQRGVAVVEFALVVSLLTLLLFGAIEIARVVWVWNAAGDATRLGARLAVVCDLNAAAIKARMAQRLTSLSAGASITITYSPSGCSAHAAPYCEAVTVALAGSTPDAAIPFVGFTPTLPPFTTTLTRESMSSADNAVCN
jgi:Flp pilus assembly protein TadG